MSAIVSGGVAQGSRWRQPAGEAVPTGASRVHRSSRRSSWHKGSGSFELSESLSGVILLYKGGNAISRVVKRVLLIFVLSVGCGRNPVAPDSERPAWLTTVIRQLEAQPVATPPAFIALYEYKGDTVYFVPQRCCDVMSVVYRSDGAVMCNADGGFAGIGDGRCPDFSQSAGTSASSGGIPGPDDTNGRVEKLTICRQDVAGTVSGRPRPEPGTDRRDRFDRERLAAARRDRDHDGHVGGTHAEDHGQIPTESRSVRAKPLHTELSDPTRQDNGMRAQPLALLSLIRRKVQVSP
jgi:hypothetical protein